MLALQSISMVLDSLIAESWKDNAQYRVLDVNACFELLYYVCNSVYGV